MTIGGLQGSVVFTFPEKNLMLKEKWIKKIKSMTKRRFSFLKSF
jgi:hypothetical protein